MTQLSPTGNATSNWGQRLWASKERLRQLLRRILDPVARLYAAKTRNTKWISEAGLAVNPVVDIIRLTRVASFSVLAGLIVLLMTGQGRELTLALAEPIADVSWARWLGWTGWLAVVQLTFVWWALSCTLMARLNLDNAKGVRRQQTKDAREKQAGKNRKDQADNSNEAEVTYPWADGFMDRTWPQQLLFACFLVYAMSIVTAAIKLNIVTWPLRVLLLVNMTLVAVGARLLWRGAADEFQPDISAGGTKATSERAADESKKPISSGMRKAMSGQAPDWEGFTVLFALAMFVVLLCVFCFLPAWGQWLGAPVVLFAFLAIATSILGALSRICHSSRFPILTTMLALPFAMSLFAGNDNHEVRSLTGPLLARPSIETALLNWRSGLGPNDCRSETDLKKRRLILVATAGGGLRAAYWTAAILGSLQDNAPQFRKCVFAISGVSGGSLGAVLFATALSEPLANDKLVCPDSRRKGFACRMDQALSRDFLGPTMGATLFPDLAQRFLPFRLFPDRAEALESAWEAAFYKEGGAKLEGGFLTLWSGQRAHPPHLLLNGTDAETGARIVTSDLDLTGRFPETLDYFDIAHAPIRLSTAAMNSARFTYVSPAGTILYPPSMPNAGLVQARIIDGGYFENFGAQTALDLLRAIKSPPKAEPTTSDDIELSVIQISSDPDLTDSSEPDFKLCGKAMGLTAPRGELGPWYERAWGRFASDSLAPIDGLLMVRESRGLLTAKQLACAVDDAGHYVHFRMKPRLWSNGGWVFGKGDERSPLGWLLTGRARDQMTDQIHCDDGTLGQLNKALAWFEATPRPRRNHECRDGNEKS
ncbi:hypothetical protein NKH85_25250 [Mesorhizobium sp. M0924]|uniref:hypothetical protein n=1 Tax=unclassified Mesorhizobium TaxID=325217 RepID=UPI003335C709